MQHNTQPVTKILTFSKPLKNTGNIGGKIKPQDKDSTRLQELSLMNSTHFGVIHY